MWDKLAPDVLAELTDPEFADRQHYSRATYRDGCHGPLCLKAERDRGRERTAERAKRDGRIYRPGGPTPATARDSELAEVAAWHLAERKKLNLPSQPHCASCACLNASVSA